MLSLTTALAGGWWLWRERAARHVRESHPKQQPEFVEDLLYACFRAGHPNVAVGVVTGGGAPYMEYHKGLLLASPEVADGLTVEELAALVRYALAAPADAGRHPGWQWQRVLRRQFQRYLEQAGDPALYIRAVIKHYAREAGQRPVARARRHIHLLAAVAGMGRDEVASLAHEAGAPPELAYPPA